MSFIKHSRSTVTSLWVPNKKTSAVKAADQIDVEDIPQDIIFDPRYVYSVTRAISARVNLNSDGFPRYELLGEINDLPAHNQHYGYTTFRGKNVHLDHYNQPELASQEIKHEPRGNLVWAWYEEDPIGDTPKVHGIEDPIYKEAGVDSWVKCLMATDRKRFPLLAEAVESGLVNKVSMGCEIINSECSICGNVARNELEYCPHSQMGSRGQVYAAKPDSPFVRSGSIRVGDPMFSFEKNHGLQFFELSWILDTQADPTAVSLDRIEGDDGSSLRDLLLNRDGQGGTLVTSNMKETIERAAKHSQMKTALEDEDEERNNVNLTIDNADKLNEVESEGEESHPADTEFNHDEPPSDQEGEFYPEFPFPCSALKSASEANPDDPMDVTINVDKCMGCLYNRSNNSGGVDCSFPEIVREGGKDPLPPGFDDPRRSDPEQDGKRHFKNDDGSDIEEFPNLKHPSDKESSSPYISGSRWVKSRRV